VSHRVPRWIAPALALATVTATPLAVRAAEGPWVSLGLLSGSTSAVGSLADYQWRVAPRAAWGAEANAGVGRFSAGLRGWSASSVQQVSAAGVSASPQVRWTSLETVGRVRLADALGIAVHATVSAGRVRLAWHPDRVTLDAGGSPVTVDFRPVDEWIGGGGLALSRPVGSRWRLGMEVERRVFALDTAHRNGSVIEYARQSFGDWSARLGVELIHGLR
jgi:hypothetical protein